MGKEGIWDWFPGLGGPCQVKKSPVQTGKWPSKATENPITWAIRIVYSDWYKRGKSWLRNEASNTGRAVLRASCMSYKEVLILCKVGT